MNTDRLTTSPMPASVCPNCGAYYIGGRCASCGYVVPDHECPASGHCIVCVDDDDLADGDEPTAVDAPDLGGSD